MTKATRSKVAYIETNDGGKPFMTLSQLAGDVADEANLDRLGQQYIGLNTRAAKGRRKVRVTITVEEVL